MEHLHAQYSAWESDLITRIGSCKPRKDAAVNARTPLTDLIVFGRRPFDAVHPVARLPEDYRDRGARPDSLGCQAGVRPACWAVAVA
jgi:hypothetical protein